MTDRTALITVALATSAVTAMGCVVGWRGMAGAGLGLSVGLLGDSLSALFAHHFPWERLTENPRSSVWLVPVLTIGKQIVLIALSYLLLSRTVASVAPFFVAFLAYHAVRLGVMLFSPSRYAALVSWAPPLNPPQ
jgi:hypothetical protein